MGTPPYQFTYTQTYPSPLTTPAVFVIALTFQVYYMHLLGLLHTCINLLIWLSGFNRFLIAKSPLKICFFYIDITLVGLHEDVISMDSLFHT